MLYNHALKGRHLKKLGDITALIIKESRRPAEVKEAFASYSKKHARFQDDEASRFSRQVWKLFEGNTVKDGAFSALYFDFLIEYSSTEAGRETLGKSATSLLEELKGAFFAEQRQTENPFDALAREIEKASVNRQIPDGMINRFVGYRRSTNSLDIIRFFFEIISPIDETKGYVKYRNVYNRRNKKWSVTGGGIFSEDNTLHLFGHAKGSDETTSLGYRSLALRIVPGTPFLCGPIISMDRSGPIAARILLVPLDLHNLTDEQKIKNDTELIDHFTDLSDSGNPRKNLEEITQNIGYLFGHRGLHGLYDYISNITAGTIKWVPDFSDETTLALLNADAALRDAIEYSDISEYRQELAEGISSRANPAVGSL